MFLITVVDRYRRIVQPHTRVYRRTLRCRIAAVKQKTTTTTKQELRTIRKYVYARMGTLVLAPTK